MVKISHASSSAKRPNAVMQIPFPSPFPSPLYHQLSSALSTDWLKSVSFDIPVLSFALPYPSALSSSPRAVFWDSLEQRKFKMLVLY